MRYTTLAFVALFLAIAFYTSKVSAQNFPVANTSLSVCPRSHGVGYLVLQNISNVVQYGISISCSSCSAVNMAQWQVDSLFLKQTVFPKSNFYKSQTAYYNLPESIASDTLYIQYATDIQLWGKCHEWIVAVSLVSINKAQQVETRTMRMVNY